MLAARDWSVKNLHDILAQRPPCEVCGRRDDTAVIVQAAKIVMDRSGLGPTRHVHHQHSVTGEPSYLDWLSADEMRVLQHAVDIAREARQRMQAGEPPLQRPALPAVTVEALPADEAPERIGSAIGSQEGDKP